MKLERLKFKRPSAASTIAERKEEDFNQNAAARQRYSRRDILVTTWLRYVLLPENQSTRAAVGAL